MAARTQRKQFSRFTLARMDCAIRANVHMQVHTSTQPVLQACTLHAGAVCTTAHESEPRLCKCFCIFVEKETKFKYRKSEDAHPENAQLLRLDVVEDRAQVVAREVLTVVDVTILA